MPPSHLISSHGAVAPDACPHVTRTGGEVGAGRTGSNRYDGVLVPLKHHLSIPGVRIPELNTSVFGA